MCVKDNLLDRLQLELNFFRQSWNEEEQKSTSVLNTYQGIYVDMLDHQRRLLAGINTRTEFDEELIRKYLSLVDLEELKLREKQS